MDIVTALEGAHWLVRKGEDALRDDLAPHVTAAVEKTATDHADELADDISESTRTEELPDFVTEDEKPSEDTAEFAITNLLYIAIGTEALERELDDLEERGESVAPDILAAELERQANESFSLDYAAVATDFCQYLERELSNNTALALKRIIALLQDDDEALAQEVLNEQGFELIDNSYIENRTIDPEYCWRRAFTFSEIHEGYPIDRGWPGDEHEHVTDRLLADIEAGGAAALVSPPGAGKTTATRMTAVEWYTQQDDGIVLYHQGGDPVTDADELTDAIQTLASYTPVLVVVEDAARSDVVPFYRTLYELEPEENVSFLLNSREREWERFDELVATHEGIDRGSQDGREIRAMRQRYVTRRVLSALETDEIRRLVTQFEDVTGRQVQASPDELESQIHAQHGASPMLLLSYHLPIGDVEAIPDEETSALEANVAETFDGITTPDEDHFAGIEDHELIADVSLLINVLNAAELPIYREYLYVVGESDEKFPEIDRIRQALDGLLFFGSDANDRYWSHHPVWSELYLQHHLDEASSETDARKQFEKTLNALFRFLNEPAKRDAIGKWIGRSTPRLQAHDDHPEALTITVVDAIFEIGEKRPRLSPLYSTTEYSGISLPETCPAATRANCALYRHRMYREQGHLQTAIEELETSYSLASENKESRSIDAVYYTAKGNVAYRTGDFEAARKYHDESLAIRRDLGDRAGEASSLDNLGIVAREQGDFEAAREYHEESLVIRRDLGDRAGEANSLNNLGLVAFEQGDFEAAREYHEESLAIERDLGDRAGEASSLNNIGLVAREQGDFEAARGYHKESLAIERDLGNRAGEASSLGNLGIVAREQGDFEAAREYHEESLVIERDFSNRAGEASSLGNLGNVALEQSDFEAAREYYEESLTIKREIGDRAGEASNLDNLGLVARRTGDFEAARGYHEESLAIEREIGDRAGEARCLNNLGNVAFEQGDFEAAHEYFEEALSVFREIGAVRCELQIISNLVTTHLQAGNEDAAVRWCQDGLDRCEEIDLPVDDREREFHRTRASVVKTAERTTELYMHALDAIVHNNHGMAFEALRETWERRNQFDPENDIYPVIFGGGVGLAAHIELTDSEELPDKPEEVLDAIADEHEQLSRPASVLFEYLQTGDAPVTSEILVEEFQTEGEEERSLLEREAVAYAKLLDTLQESAD